jgi:uncharacterized C2H2 Zn-finger protein
MIITAYKCPHTGKLFEEQAKYKKHLRKIAGERRMQRKIERTKLDKEQFWVDNFWNKVRSIEQLKKAFIVHAERLGMNGIENDYGKWGKKYPKTVPLLKKFSEFSARFDVSVSNSHDAPIGGVTNWGRKDTLKDGSPAPRGYPGISGRIDYQVEWDATRSSEYPGGSSMWEGLRFHTGTGGGGGFKPYTDDKTKGLQSFGYDWRLFLADWPGLQQSYMEATDAYEKAKMMHILKHGTNMNGFKFDLDEWVNNKYPAEDYV